MKIKYADKIYQVVDTVEFDGRIYYTGSMSQIMILNVFAMELSQASLMTVKKEAGESLTQVYITISFMMLRSLRIVSMEGLMQMLR